jgi:transposase
MAALPILGIDVSKATLDVHLLSEGKSYDQCFDNNADGFKQLQMWLKEQRAKAVHACLEATGLYGEELAHFLYLQGYQVSVVNPARIKKYADSQLRRNKTDKLDARIIADFCRTQQPRLWTPPDAAWRALRDLVRHREDLITMRQQERNRLDAGVQAAVVIENLKQHIAFLDAQLDDLDRQIKDHIDQHPDLKHQRDLLVSIKGISAKTAAVLLAEVRDFTAFENVRELVAYAGLNPAQYRSGSSVRGKTRISKQGNAAIRKALYMPALSAKRTNPLIKPLCDRLVLEGQPPMVAVVAAMRKLLHLSYGVLKTRTSFDPLYLSQAALST